MRLVFSQFVDVLYCALAKDNFRNYIRFTLTFVNSPNLPFYLFCCIRFSKFKMSNNMNNNMNNICKIL